MKGKTLVTAVFLVLSLFLAMETSLASARTTISFETSSWEIDNVTTTYVDGKKPQIITQFETHGQMTGDLEGYFVWEQRAVTYSTVVDGNWVFLSFKADGYIQIYVSQGTERIAIHFTYTAVPDETQNWRLAKSSWTIVSGTGVWAAVSGKGTMAEFPAPAIGWSFAGTVS